jgi:hypothetical protein
MVEPVQIHTCAMHGGLAISEAAVPIGHAHSAAGHHMAMHPVAGHSNHDRNNDEQSQQCSCLGDCNAGSAPIGLTTVALALVVPGVIDGSSANYDYSSPAFVAPHFLLPFGNGPPTGFSRA